LVSGLSYTMKVIFHSIYKSNTFSPNKQINSKLFFIKLSFFHKTIKTKCESECEFEM